MKIKLKSNGQVIDPPERVANRYIKLGRAILYVEPKPVEIMEKEKPKKKTKKEKIDESYTECYNDL